MSILSNLIAKEIKGLSRSLIHDASYMQEIKAAFESAEFVERDLVEAIPLGSRNKVIIESLKLVPRNDLGMFLEFGVAKGDSLNLIAHNINTQVYGFDSFRGLPENWRSGFPVGAFDTQGQQPKVRNNVELVVGSFDKSLPAFLKEHKENASFVHIDCDLYSSTQTVLNSLRGRIVPGTVIVFDEYFNFPNWKRGEFKAFAEFVKENDLKFNYRYYNSNGENLSVLIR